MNRRHYGWVAFAVGVCLALFSCSKKMIISPDGKPVMSCDEQIEELKRWLAYINGYNKCAAWGHRNYTGDLVKVDLEINHVSGITPFAIRDDRFETCRKNKVIFNKPVSQVGKFHEIAHDCRNSRITLFISPEAGWESVVRVCEGIIRAGIFEVYFVFEESKQFKEEPPDTSLRQEIALHIAKIDKSTKRGKKPAFPVDEIGSYLKECPRIKEVFRGFERRSCCRRIGKIDSRLPEVMEECGCVPPLTKLKSIIWPMVWVGQMRLEMLVKLALPGTEDCHEIAQEGILPWSEAYKSVTDAAKEQKDNKLWNQQYEGKPLCFVSKALAPAKIAPMKIEIPLMEKRKAKIEAEYERLLKEERKQLMGQLQIPEGPRKADYFFQLADRYYRKYELTREKEMKEYDDNIGRWEELKEKKLTAPKPVMTYKARHIWGKAAIDILRVLLENYKDYHRRDEVLFVLGYCLIETGKTQEGVKVYRQLAGEFPESPYVPDSYLVLGEHFFNAGDFIRAKKEYENSAKHKGTKASFLAMYKIAWCHFRLGEKAQAREAMKKVAAEADSKKLRGQANRELISIFIYQQE